MLKDFFFKKNPMRIYLLKNFLLKIFFKLYSLIVSQPSKKDPIENIAIFSTTGLGDTLWATPALKVLKTQNPNCKITLLTSAVGKEVLLNNPYIDEVIVYSLFSFFNLFFHLKEKKFDAILIFHASQRKIFILAKLLNPYYLVGTMGRSKDLDFLLTHKVLTHSKEHEIVRRLKLLEAIHVHSTEKPTLELFITDEERQEADHFLRSHHIGKNERLIGVQMGSKDPFKRWPKEYFESVLEKLQHKYPHKIILTGAMNEAKLVKSTAKLIPHSLPIYGQISLRCMIAIIEKMDLFLTNDTGPMHLAFAMNIPTIALFSPTHPENCGPLHAKNAFIEYAPRCCFPCLQKNCREPFCMRQINKETVLTHATSILNQPPEKI